MVKQLTIWEGLGSCLVMLAASLSPESVEDLDTISSTLENILAVVLYSSVLLNTLATHESEITLPA